MSDVRLEINLPYLIIEDGKVKEVNSLFTDFTGYLEQDIVSKDSSAAFKLLRIAPTFDFNYPTENNSHFLFTKNLNYKNIQISIEEVPNSSKIICKFSEKENSSFEDNFKYLNSLYEQDMMGVALLSVPEFILLKANKKCLSYLDKQYNCLDNVLGKRIQEFCTKCADTSCEATLRNVIDNGEPVQFNDCQCINQSLGNAYFNVFITPIKEEGTIKYLVLNTIDVTKEVSRRKEIEETLKMQGEFFSFITHEFRTPLTTISSTIQLLELVYKKEISGKLNKYMKMIKRNIFQQLRLVNNLLDVTKAEAGYLKVHHKNYDIVAITKVIVLSIDTFAKARNIQIKFKSSLKEKNIALDDEKYERIILNLLSNAIKFTPENKNIYISISANDGKVFICIKDEGIGIKKEKLPIIFDRFRQSGSDYIRESEGTGIGLYLVKLLVTALGGEISVVSTESKGSRFIITLPDKVAIEEEIVSLPELTNNRLIQGMEIEFSSIYTD